MKVPLYKVYARLETCDAVFVNCKDVKNLLCVPSVDMLTGNPENEFLYLSSGDGLFATKFTEGDNQKVTASSYSYYLTDTDSDGEDDLIEVTPLYKKYLE